MVTLCAQFHQAIELVGSRWTGAILQVLLNGRERFSGLAASIPQISDRMLSERLQALEAEGLVTRHVVPDTPVRVEYELTEKGRELQGSMVAISKWASKWIPPPASGQGVTPEAARRVTRRRGRPPGSGRSTRKRS